MPLSQRAPRAVCAALLACAAGGAAAQADLRWGLSAGLTDRHLTESTESRDRLVAERGPMARLQFDARLTLPGGGALRGEAEIAGGSLDYAGRTQAGVPLSTRSDHRDLSAGLQWRPLPAASWGEAWLTVRVLQQRRDIRSTASATGLLETSDLVLPGLRWSHAFQSGGWRWEPSVEWRASARHDLEVDYHGLFDTSDLKGGRRQETVLGLAVVPGDAPWQVSVEWQRARQVASPRQPLYRGGAPVGTVLQPRIAIDDLTLRVRRAF